MTWNNYPLNCSLGVQGAGPVGQLVGEGRARRARSHGRVRPGQGRQRDPRLQGENSGIRSGYGLLPWIKMLRVGTLI